MAIIEGGAGVTKYAYYTIGGYYSATYGSFDGVQYSQSGTFNPVQDHSVKNIGGYVTVQHQLSGDSMRLHVLKDCHIKAISEPSHSIDGDYHAGDYIGFPGNYSQAWSGYAVNFLNMAITPV